MVFIWVMFYGLTYSVSQQLALALHVKNGVTALMMILYMSILLAWLMKSGWGSRIGLRFPSQDMRSWIGYLLPMLALPACNLYYAGQGSVSLDTLVLLLCGAVAEELLFRGWMLSSLSSKPVLAVLVSGMAFALLHAANIHRMPDHDLVLLQVLSAFCFSLPCGAVALCSGSVIPSVALHAIINLTGASSGLPAYAVIICMAIHVFCGVLFIWNLRFNDKERLS